MKREDKLLLAMWGPKVALTSLAGIGPVALQEAEQAGYVTSARQRSRYSNKLNSIVAITDTGSVRLNELREVQHLEYEEQLVRKSTELGPCIACGAAVQLHMRYWRCSDAACTLHQEVPEAYWLALRAAVMALEREHEEALEYAEQHGQRCTCRECYRGP